MKNIKSIIIGSLVLLALAIAVFGPQKVLSHMTAGRERLSAGIDEVSSDAQEAARIRVLLRKADEDILEYQDRLADVQSQLAADGRTIKRIEMEIANQRDILGKERDMLQQDKPSYKIQGRSYSRSQVEQDALSRMNHAKSLEKDLDLKRQVVSRLQRAVADGRKNLDKALAARHEMAGELKVLVTRLDGARVLNKVNEVAKNLSEAPFAPQSEIGKALKAFEKRVRKAERRNDAFSTEARSGVIIDWEASAGTNVSQALEEFLDSSSGRETPVAEDGEIAPASAEDSEGRVYTWDEAESSYTWDEGSEALEEKVDAALEGAE